MGAYLFRPLLQLLLCTSAASVVLPFAPSPTREAPLVGRVPAGPITLSELGTRNAPLNIEREMSFIADESIALNVLFYRFV